MRNLKKSTIILLILILASSIFISGCFRGGKNENELVIYSSRNERFVQEMLDKFTGETGVEVKALHGVNPLQIVEESNNVRADILISNDLGALGYLQQKGYLQSVSPDGIESIPAQFRADDNSFFALSTRARGFIYNKDLVAYEEMPKSIEDLFDAKWSGLPGGYAITNGGNGGMIAHVSALRFEWGDEKTARWISSIKENASGIYQGHGDIRRAVGSGEHSFGLVNNYYFHQQLLEPENNNVGFIYLDQEDNQMGVVVNAAGLGVIKDGPNYENTVKFLNWILKPENQLAFVGESLEIPINSELDADYPQSVKEVVVQLADLKVQNMPLKELGKYFEDTKKLIEDSGLDLELR